MSPRREHTPTVRIELATPELVKKHVNEVMDTSLDAKYEADRSSQEIAIGLARCQLLNLEESNFLRGPW